jgi:hypothetical protein
MKQYRITSANFVLPGETGEQDAVMDAADLSEIKKLAGIVETAPVPGGLQGAVAGLMDNVPNSTEYGVASPVGTIENPKEKTRRELEREYNAKTGTDLWFLINFADARDLRRQIESYLDKHPQYQQRPLPGQDS